MEKKHEVKRTIVWLCMFQSFRGEVIRWLAERAGEEGIDLKGMLDEEAQGSSKFCEYPLQDGWVGGF